MAAELPNVAEVLGPLLLRVEVERRPLLLALAERMAADRYRFWAEQVERADDRATLLACSAREEKIAERAEGVVPNASGIQQEILEKNPDLPDVNRSLFASYSLREQFQIQAEGERAGAAAWLAFAAEQADPKVRDSYRSCAPLEEQNALALESILARSE